MEPNQSPEQQPQKAELSQEMLQELISREFGDARQTIASYLRRQGVAEDEINNGVNAKLKETIDANNVLGYTTPEKKYGQAVVDLLAEYFHIDYRSLSTMDVLMFDILAGSYARRNPGKIQEFLSPEQNERIEKTMEQLRKSSGK